MVQCTDALGLALALPPAGPPRRAPDLSDRSVQADLTRRLQAALPHGWAVTGTEAGVAPPDWHTDAPRAGFAVSGASGPHTFSFYFLPRDWVGIRKLPNAAPRNTYWEGILTDGTVLTVTASTHPQFPAQVRQVSPWRSSPSITNGGFEEATRAFGGGQALADATAADLIRRHCRTPAEFTEAAHSLVVLGVAARTVFLRAVREVDGPDRELFCSAVGHFDGADAVDALCDVLADARISDYTRKYAVYGLGARTGPAVNRALRTAASQMTTTESLEVVLAALTVRHDAWAAADLMAAFDRAAGDANKLLIAHALAGIRSREARPAVERYAADCRRRAAADPAVRPTARWAGLAAERLGAVGAVGPVRYYLLPPDRPRLGGRMDLTVVVENASDEWRCPEADPVSALVVDGTPVKWFPPPRPVPIVSLGGGPQPTLGPGTLQTLTYDLSAVIRAAGVHTVQYVGREAASAPVTVEVAAPLR